MPADPERDIEKTLKAYAERRRQQAGAPLEPHPATRRMLQAEAAREHASMAKQGGFREEWTGWLRRRIVLVSALGTTAVVVAVALTLALNRSKREQMAFYSRSFESTSAPTPGAMPPERELAKARPADNSVNDKKAGANGVAAAPPPEAPAVASLDQQAAGASGEKKQKDAGNVAVSGTTAGRGNVLSDRESTVRLGAIPQSAVLAPARVPPENGSAGPAQPQTESLASSARTADGSIAIPGAQPPNPPPAFGVQRADEFQKSASSDVLAFKSDAASNMQRDTLALKSATTQASTVTSATPPARDSTSAVPAGANSFAASDSIASGAFTQRFSRLPTAPRGMATTKSSRNRGVLDSFRVEQSGSTMRVVDGDGSVYFGYVQTSDQALERFDDLSTRNLQADEPVQISGLTSEPGQTITNGLPLQTLFFRVTGTNRTLRQSVVFSGTLIPGPPQTTGVRTGLQAHVSSGPGASPSGSAVGGAVPPRGSQLRGRALIGGTNAVDVNAAPSAR